MYTLYLSDRRIFALNLSHASFFLPFHDARRKTQRSSRLSKNNAGPPLPCSAAATAFGTVKFASCVGMAWWGVGGEAKSGNLCYVFFALCLVFSLIITETYWPSDQLNVKYGAGGEKRQGWRIWWLVVFVMVIYYSFGFCLKYAWNLGTQISNKDRRWFNVLCWSDVYRAKKIAGLHLLWRSRALCLACVLL